MALINGKIIPINSGRFPFQVIEIDDDRCYYQEEEKVIILFVAHVIMLICVWPCKFNLPVRIIVGVVIEVALPAFFKYG